MRTSSCHNAAANSAELLTPRWVPRPTSRICVHRHTPELVPLRLRLLLPSLRLLLLAEPPGQRWEAALVSNHKLQAALPLLVVQFVQHDSPAKQDL